MKSTCLGVTRLAKLLAIVMGVHAVPSYGWAQGHEGHPPATEAKPVMSMPMPGVGGGTPTTAPPPLARPAVQLPTTPRAPGGAGASPPEPNGFGRPWPKPVNDAALNGFLLFDLLEFQLGQDVTAARWDVVGWLGGDSQRIWVKSEGRYNGVPRTGEGDLQLLYGQLISPFMDFQAGFRWEQQLSWDNKQGRAFGVVGVQGLVPFGMELEAAIFLSTNADVSARLTLTQDFALTQRLVLQARFEANAAIQSVPRFGIGSGVNDIEPGLRLRYEIMREFAPYIGVSWLKSFGETARLRTNSGDSASAFTFVAGVRLWF